MSGTPGKLAPPYPVERCANVDCRRVLADHEGGAFLYSNLATGKLVVFCDDCGRSVELNMPTTYALVAV